MGSEMCIRDRVSEGREVVTGLFQRRETDEMLSRPIPIIRVIAQ